MPCAAGLARPGRDARRLTKLLAPKLDTVDPGFGIEVITVFAARRRTPGRRPGPAGRRSRDQPGRDPGAAGRSPDQPPGREPRLARRSPMRATSRTLGDPQRAPLDPPGRGMGSRPPRPVRLFKRPEAIDRHGQAARRPAGAVHLARPSHRVRAPKAPNASARNGGAPASTRTGPARSATITASRTRPAAGSGSIGQGCSAKRKRRNGGCMACLADVGDGPSGHLPQRGDYRSRCSPSGGGGSGEGGRGLHDPRLRRTPGHHQLLLPARGLPRPGADADRPRPWA
jgi:hypothetical protein